MSDQLCASVRHTLFLTEREDKTKETRRDHWERAGIEIEEPEVWAAGTHLLGWFWDMDSLCGANGFGGMNPLDAAKIQAWSSLTATIIEPWEGKILLDMARARQSGPEEAVEHETPVSQAFTPAVFDALFG